MTRTFDCAGHTPLLGEPAFDRVNRLIEAFVLERVERPARAALQAVAAASSKA